MLHTPLKGRVNKKGLPSFATAGLRLRNATLTESDGPENGASPLLGNDFGGDVADAGAGQADGTGRTRGKVEDAPLDEGTTVVDRDDDALAAMGHPELGAERQRAVGCGHGVLVEALTGCGPAAGFTAVKRGLAGEAAPGALGADRGIGVQPVAAGCRGFAGVMVVVVMAMMPGFGGSLGDTAAGQESCGDQGEGRTRPG